MFIKKIHLNLLSVMTLVFLLISCSENSNITTAEVPIENSPPKVETPPTQTKPITTTSSTKTIKPTPTPEVEALFLYNRGLNQLHAEKFIEAVNTFTTLIKRMPNLAIAYKSRAAAYYHIERFDLARTDIQQALLLDVDLGGARLYLGLIHKEEGNFEEAQKNLQMAVNLIHPIRETEELIIAKSALEDLKR